MNSMEFAEKMGVSYHSAMRWLRLGIVPGAVKVGPRQEWDVPEEALKMEKPRPGPKYKEGAIIKTRDESRQVLELRKELADLNKRHMDQMEKYAGLLGKYDKAEAAIRHWQKLHDEMGEKFRTEVDIRFGVEAENANFKAYIRTLEGSLEAELANVEIRTRQREDFRRLYEEVLAQMDHKIKQITQLEEEVRSLKEKSSWEKRTEMVSDSIPNTD